jgi:spermidine synthase
VQISTDLHAAIYLQRLVMWEQSTAGARHHAIQWLSSIQLSRVAGTMAIVLLAAALIAWHSRKQTASVRRMVVFSIGTTGFSTMALSIIWLFAFQSLYGYVYQRIGWIVALFMGGLVIGALWGKHRGQKFTRRPMDLIRIDALLAALSLAAPLVLHGLQGIASALFVETTISALVAFTGVLGGAAFAVAGDIMGTTTPAQAGSTATWIVWADHLGAAVGALLTGVFLVPVYGIPITASGIAIIKIVAVILLLFVRPNPRCAEASS